MTIRANSPRQRFQKRASPLAFRSESSCRADSSSAACSETTSREVFRRFLAAGTEFSSLCSPPFSFGAKRVSSSAGESFAGRLSGERGRRSWDAREWRLVYRVGLFEFSQFGRIRVILILQGMGIPACAAPAFCACLQCQSTGAQSRGVWKAGRLYPSP